MPRKRTSHSATSTTEIAQVTSFSMYASDLELLDLKTQQLCKRDNTTSKWNMSKVLRAAIRQLDINKLEPPY